MNKRLLTIPLAMCIGFMLVSVKIALTASNDHYAERALSQSTREKQAGISYGNIYDADFEKLVNETEISEKVEIGGEVLSVKGVQRYSEKQTASHLIGYTSDNIGICGIEYAYDEFLREQKHQTVISCFKDGINFLTFGNIKAVSSGNKNAGVVTTLDKGIQEICEDISDEKISKGAIVVMEVKTGDIKAMVSRPDYSPLDLKKALSDEENAPLLNRALCSYNLGSIFKLVTASAAIEQGLDTNEKFFCDGKIDVKGLTFRCHNLSGHGEMDIKSAIIHSCNPYFINLGLKTESSKLLWYASALSYGRPIKLCDGIASRSGYLQSIDELSNEAEKANMVFGQGKLLATPLQVTSATCAYANKGALPKARLIKGVTYDGKTVENEEQKSFTNAIKESTADKIKEFMTAMIEDESNIKAKPRLTTAGAKTATAQTGKFAEDGHEIYNCWITGFFPADAPKYAVTVLIEDGVGSLRDCGPVFAQIADSIIENNY